MSRSPSSFFRSSNRNSGSNFFSSHRRVPSYQEPDPSTSSLAPPENTLTILRNPSDSSSNSGSMPSSSSLAVRGMERLEKRRTMEERNFLQSKARAQNLNPPVDLRLLDYVASYDENLMCPICRCPFVDPVVLTECDHCFCRECIRQTWTTSTSYNPLGPRGDCPTCRTPAKLGPRSATSKILINILDDLKVKCPKSNEGCPAEVKRGEVQDHMTIYCGFALVECQSSGCELAVRRKDASQDCLHYGVSCLSCREEMQKCALEAHWTRQCPDRLVECKLCMEEVFYRDFGEHSTQHCSAITIPCVGTALGCAFKGKKSRVEDHAKTCTFALLAPVIAGQTERLEVQEQAQKQMSRKLEVLENGFGAMQNILYPKVEEDSQPTSRGHDAASSRNTLVSPIDPSRSHDTEDFPPFTLDFDDDHTASFPPPATANEGGPYVSPLHHLLSMHESLRDELARMSAAIQELDGRTQMQILNENLRTREAMGHLGAQVGGMQRQVHWLTSARLQKREDGPASVVGEAARVLEGIVGSGTGMRRRASEEGRTKL